MAYFSENMRYLLWRERVQHEHWVSQLATWAGVERLRAEALLHGAEAEPEEVQHLARALDISEESLVSERLLTTYGVNVLQANLRYLIDRIDHGQKKQLASELGIHPATISRWYNGELHPRKAHQGAICHYFGLPRSIDLENEVLFLSMTPLLDRKAWLHQQIDNLDSVKLDELFPALRLMFRDEAS